MSDLTIEYRDDALTIGLAPNADGNYTFTPDGLAALCRTVVEADRARIADARAAGRTRVVRDVERDETGLIVRLVEREILDV